MFHQNCIPVKKILQEEIISLSLRWVISILFLFLGCFPDLLFVGKSGLVRKCPCQVVPRGPSSLPERADHFGGNKAWSSRGQGDHRKTQRQKIGADHISTGNGFKQFYYGLLCYWGASVCGLVAVYINSVYSIRLRVFRPRKFWRRIIETVHLKI